MQSLLVALSSKDDCGWRLILQMLQWTKASLQCSALAFHLQLVLQLKMKGLMDIPVNIADTVTKYQKIVSPIMKF